MKKVLIISTVGLNYEGITSVILNYCSNMDRSNLEFVFLAYTDMNLTLKEKFEYIGKIINVPKRKKDVKAYIKALNQVLVEKYDVVHIHGNSGTMAIEVLLAKLHGVNTIITHCHNTTCDHPIVNKILRIPVILFSDVKIACSKAAGDWFYHNNYIVLNNAINISRFKYNPIFREKIRQEFKIGDSILIGHIGHFSEQKNHSFLIDVFNVVHSRIQKTKLLLVSSGPDLDKIKAKVKNLGLEQDVLFAGRRNDADKLYQAMDLFVLPSLWEGLPLVLLEAQASGLSVVVSDKVTEESRCTDHFHLLPLDIGADAWADCICDLIRTNLVHFENDGECVRRCNFDIAEETEKLRAIYMK